MEGLLAQLFGVFEPCVLERGEFTFQLRYLCLLLAEGNIIGSVHLEQLRSCTFELAADCSHLALDRRALLLEFAQLALQGNRSVDMRC